MEMETAGDPMTELKWTHRTTEKIADQLRALDIFISANTVAKLLKEMKFSLRVNSKKIPSQQHPDRDEQFQYIAQIREQFAFEGNPIISVDCKKKEAIGNFKNNGQVWSPTPIKVNDHDFAHLGEGKAIPLGIYDLQHNRGSVFIGTSHETADFVVDSINRWWRYQGTHQYKGKKKILILSDSGGCDGYNRKAWKYHLQHKLCNRFGGIQATVCHYPPGSSKWNPIEHRLFSEISKNWKGKPLDSYETALKYINTTTTKTGLSVKSYLNTRKYQTGQKFSDQQINELELQKHDTLPMFNYTLSPNKILN